MRRRMAALSICLAGTHKQGLRPRSTHPSPPSRRDHAVENTTVRNRPRSMQAVSKPMREPGPALTQQ